MNREVGLGSHSLSHFPPSLISLTVSVDVKHNERRLCRAHELCEQGGGPGISFPFPFHPVPNKPYGFCGREAQRKKTVQSS